MNQQDLENYRVRFRLELLERLVLQHALTEPVLNRQLTMADSLFLLKDWLDNNSAAVDRMVGEAFQGDPAMTALHADEAAEIVNNMKSILDKIAQQ
jgi:hypothetical protein